MNIVNSLLSYLKKTQDKKDTDNKIPKQTLFLYIFLFSILFLGFFLYVLIIFSPSGTDVYTHMVNTNRMAASNSLTDFYQKSQIDEYLGYDYPFGLWYFGSIIIKITGLDIYTIVSIIPFIVMIGCLLIYYCYAHELLLSRDGAILSLIFLISMPYVTLLLLNYSGSVFSLSFLIAILYLCLKKIQLTNLFLMLILVITLCFTHVGTYVFLTFTALVYFIFLAIIWKKFDVNFYILLTMLIFGYNATVELFPTIHPHYVDKGYLIISTSQSIAEAFHIDVIRQLGEIYFNTLFVSNSYAYAILWAGMILAAGVICVKIRTTAEEFYKGHTHPAGLPIIGSITSVSHDISFAPFWLGPVQTVLSFIGFFKIEPRGKCLALTLLITAYLPGSLQGAEGTGSLREISFILLILPVLAAAGFLFLLPKITSFSVTPVKKSLAILLCLIIIVPLIAAPIIGRLYYEPGLTMSQEEKNNLVWLGTVGTPSEGASGSGYRERMTLYANKRVPSIPSGTDNRRAGEALTNTFFKEKSENFTTTLSSYGIQYLIGSDRTFKGMGRSTEFLKQSLKIDSNTMVDKIDSSGNFFGIYKVISVPPAQRVTSTDPLYFESVMTNNSVQDVGSSFIYENDYYKIKISDSVPSIQYFGTKTNDRLGDGYLLDTITLGWDMANNDTHESSTYDLSSLKYTNISMSANEIMYKTQVMGVNNTQKLVTMYVKFIFYEKVMKREITIVNDMANPGRGWAITGRLSSAFFVPLQYFDYHTVGPGSEKWVHKIRYPAQDSVTLDNDKFDSVYFNDGSKGFFVSYGDSIPYPHYLSYRGSPSIEYGRVAIRSEVALLPSEPASLVQFFSVKNPADAMRDIKETISVTPYDYPNSIIPLIITGSTNTINQSAYEKNFYAKIREKNISFTLALPQPMGKQYGELKSTGVNFSGSVVLKDPANLSKEIQTLKTDYKINGVMFSKFSYNFDSIKILQDNNLSYAIAYLRGSPSDELNREGVRNPKFAYYDGERTDVVFIPITLPTSSQLDMDYDINTVFWQWNETIKSVVDIGGMAVFVWNPDDVGNPDYQNRTMKLLEYAQNRGMTITTPDTVAVHYKKLQNVNVIAIKDGDSVFLTAHNMNADRIQGVTYKLELPSIEDTCPYTITNGTIPRYELKDNECKVYASFDLEAGETREIQVIPPSIKKQFNADIPPLVHGENQITITGEDGLPLRKASVLIDTKYYQSNNKGIVKFSVSHGNYSLRIEKPGYYPLVTEVEVKARIYRLINWVSDIFGGSNKV